MASSVQETYLSRFAAGYAGMALPGSKDDLPVANENTTAIEHGILCLRGAADGLVRPLLSSDEPATDVDAIVTTHATVAAKLSLSGTDLNGVVGQAEMWPPRQITFIADSHANWDPAVVAIFGTDYLGRPIQEVMEMPDGGNVTLTTTQHFSTVTRIDVQTQGGTGGSFTVGINSVLGPLDKKALGVSIRRSVEESATYARYKEFEVRRKGRILVAVEAAVTPLLPVLVRVVATGAEVRGAFRGTADSNDCAPFRGARFATTTTGAGYAELELS